MGTKTKWLYLLRDGSVEYNMKDAKVRLGVSKTRLVGMLKSGTLTRIRNTNTETLNGYDKITT